MIVYDGLDSPGLPRTDRVLAVGAFDGVHRGHQRLLTHVCRMADEYGVESAIMTFEPVPAQVFRPDGYDNVRLTTRDERRRELIKYCVGSAVVADFNEDLRQMSAYDFAREILVERLGVVALVASKTHTFGRNAEADVQAITQLGMELGFEVHALPPILEEGHRISSTDVRQRLKRGDIEGANHWLGRHYDLAGEVVTGRGVGRQLGFPTANIQPVREKLVPADGVYACAARVEVDDQPQTDWMPAAVSVGGAPTFDVYERIVEAHLLSEGEFDLPGKSVRLLFLSRLRDNVKYEDIDALRQQIDRDIDVVEEEFAASGVCEIPSRAPATRTPDPPDRVL